MGDASGLLRVSRLADFSDQIFGAGLHVSTGQPVQEARRLLEPLVLVPVRRLKFLPVVKRVVKDTESFREGKRKKES